MSASGIHRAACLGGDRSEPRVLFVPDLDAVRLRTDFQRTAETPDVVALACRHDVTAALAVIEWIQQQWRQVPLLLLSQPLASHDALLLFQRGMRGWLPTGESRERFNKAVRALASGDTWFPRRLSDSLLTLALLSRQQPAPLPPEFADLTGRELDVARELVNGLANKQIAGKLQISEQTVKVHLRSAFAKLRVRSRVELILLATDAPAPAGARARRVDARS